MLVDPASLYDFLSKLDLFGKLDEEELNLVVEAAHTRLYHPNEVIYSVGDDAVDFYIIYNGKVQIQRELDEGQEYTGDLVPGDYFGREVLAGEDYRWTNATALDDTLLIYIDGEYLLGLKRDIPLLRNRLPMVGSSFKLMWDAPISWREPGEVVYYIARRHPFFALVRLFGPALLLIAALVFVLLGELILPAMITPLLVAGVLAIIAVGWGIWGYIDWTNDYYILTDRRVIYLERIIFLYDSRTEAPMDAILAVNKFTTWFGRQIGYGNVTVRSFTGTIVLEQIANVDEVQVMIEKLLLRAKSRRAVEDKRTIDRTISSRLGGRPAPGARQPQPQPKPQPKPQEQSEEEEELVPTSVRVGGFQKFLINFLHLRMEENGIITYRKHWFVLLQQVWWPSLILILLLVVFLARVFGFILIFSIGTLALLEFTVGFFITLWWVYQYIDWTNDIYIITYDQIIDVDKKPLGSESRKAAPIKNILSIEYERLGFIGYVLNFGTVYIKVGETTFTFDTVFNPSEVQRELFNRFSEVKFKEKQAEDEAEARRMADWIEGYHRWQEQQGPPGPPVPPGPPTSPFPR